MKKNLKDLYCQRPHVVIVGAVLQERSWENLAQR